MKCLLTIVTSLFLVAQPALASKSGDLLSCGIVEVVEASNGIVAYLNRNPNAADTVSGVAIYWLGYPDYSFYLDVTNSALHCLKDRGVVTSVNFGAQVLWKKAR